MNSNLQLRYPGVDFLGHRSSASSIDKEVIISPGARIDLSQGVQIRNRSVIGRDAIIEGGYIQSSIIHGRVSGGRIEDSEIEVFARITGGGLCRCSIRGHAQVQSGTLLDTIVADQAQVHGGQATSCEISGNSRVTGGFLNQSIVQGDALIAGGEATDSKIADSSRITGGFLINSIVHGDALVNTGRFSHTKIGHNIASLHRSSVGKELPYQEVSITKIKPGPGLALSRLSSQPRITHLPEVIIDRITKQLITDAVCTRDGETHNRSTISPQNAHAAYPNRAVQDISNRYREFIAVSGLIQMRGYTYRLPFQLPRIFDPITSRPDSVQNPLTTGNSPPANDSQYSFLTKFDTIFLVDDSGSMAGRYWKEAEEAIAAITPICTQYDPDGIDIFFLNHCSALDKSGGYPHVSSPSAVQEIFRNVQPGGMTPVGKCLREILFPYLRRVEKMAANTDEYGNLLKPDLAVRPINVIVITDGAFSDDAESVILNAARTLDKCQAIPWQIGIQFFQIGTDIAAQKYLEQLDDGLGKAVKNDHVRDIVDTVPWKGQTGRTLSGDGILKVVLGAVNKRLDRQKAHSSETSIRPFC